MFERIKNLTKKYSDRDLSRFKINPERNWSILMAIFFFTATVIFISEYLLLANISNSLSNINPDNSLAGLSIDSATLLKTVKDWSTREGKFNNLLNSQPTQLIDPSI